MKKEFKARLKTYSFWVSLASAILLLFQSIAKPLGLHIDEIVYMSVVNSALGVFVVLGIISHPSQNLVDKENSMQDEVFLENKKQEKDEKIMPQIVDNDEYKQIKENIIKYQ